MDLWIQPGISCISELPFKCTNSHCVYILPILENPWTNQEQNGTDVCSLYPNVRLHWWTCLQNNSPNYRHLNWDKGMCTKFGNSLVSLPQTLLRRDLSLAYSSFFTCYCLATWWCARWNLQKGLSGDLLNIWIGLQV